MTKQFSKTLPVVLLFAFIAAVFYHQYFYTPRRILQQTLTQFETDLRNHNLTNVRMIVSPQAPLYDHLATPDLLNALEQFSPGIEVVSANYTAGSANKTIHGNARMKAKQDGKYREIGTVFIKNQDNTWKITQFGTPVL